MSVTDAEDGPVDCAGVTVQTFLGHDGHVHLAGTTTGCHGAVQTSLDPGHSLGQNLFYQVRASYTDSGAPGVAPLTATETATLQLQRRQAEHYSDQTGIEVEGTSDPEGGGRNLTDIDHADWISFGPINLDGISTVAYRVASGGTGGRIEVHTDTIDGPIVGIADVPPTGGWQTWTEVVGAITDPGGTHDLFLEFVRSPGDQALFDLNWIEFGGLGSSCDPEALPSDEFDDARLDPCRWDRIVREDARTYRVNGGIVRIATQRGHFFGPSETGGRNLLLQSSDHAEPDYTLETKFTARLDHGYQQAGLLVYADDDNHVKLDAVADPGSSRVTRIELRSEVEGIVQIPRPQLNVPPGASTIYLRLTKSGTSYTGSVSPDGLTWWELPAPVQNAATGSPLFGLFAIGVVQTQARTVDFDYFRVS